MPPRRSAQSIAAAKLDAISKRGVKIRAWGPKVTEIYPFGWTRIASRQPVGEASVRTLGNFIDSAPIRSRAV
jgi:hypothetical protein